jgi:hypothetical protein
VTSNDLREHATPLPWEMVFGLLGWATLQALEGSVQA